MGLGQLAWVPPGRGGGDTSAPACLLTSEVSTPVLAAFSVTATFSKAVTGFVVGDITVTNATLSNFAGSGSVYTFTVTPSADGALTVQVPATVCQDSGGRWNTISNELSYTADITAPSCVLSTSVTEPATVLFTVTATFSETVTGFVIGDITVSNATLSNFVAVSGAVYTVDITPSLATGNISIQVGAGVCQDATGHNNTASNTLSIEQLIFILRSLFTSNITAGSMNGASLEPGPGVFTATDGSSIFAASGGVGVVNGTPAGNSNLRLPAQSRLGGRAFVFDIPARTTVASSSLRLGWLTTGTNLEGGVAYPSVNALGVVEYGSSVWSYALGAGTHRVISILRGLKGAYVLGRVASDSVIEGTYYLLWPAYSQVDISLTPAVLAMASTAVNATIDNFGVIDLGGTYGETFGLATDWIQTPATGNTLTTVADGWVELTWTPTAGETLDIQFRRTDDDNCLILRAVQADGKIYLYKKETGSETELGATGGLSQTLTAGVAVRLVILAYGEVLRTWGNRTAKHNTTSTFNQTATGAKASGFTTGADFASHPWTVTL